MTGERMKSMGMTILAASDKRGLGPDRVRQQTANPVRAIHGKAVTDGKAMSPS
jgi:hypothetical protein